MVGNFIMTQEQREKIRQSLLGHIVNEETRNKISERLKGIRCSPKTEFKKGMIPWNKGIKKLIKPNIGSFKKGNRVSIKTEFKKGFIPWNKGINKYLKESKIIRASLEYIKWRQDVFIRDDFTCQKCGIRGVYLHAHHIKELCKLIKIMMNELPLLNIYEALKIYTPFWDLNNGITLCKECHKKEHIGRK